jgi:hypothetical protein
MGPNGALTKNDYVREANGKILLSFRDTSTLMMEVACTPETTAISPTTTQCNNRRTELMSIINYRERLK